MAPKENKSVTKKRNADGEMFYIKMKKSRENKRKELKKLKDELRYLHGCHSLPDHERCMIGKTDRCPTRPQR